MHELMDWWTFLLNLNIFEMLKHTLKQLKDCEMRTNWKKLYTLVMCVAVALHVIFYFLQYAILMMWLKHTPHFVQCSGWMRFCTVHILSMIEYFFRIKTSMSRLEDHWVLAVITTNELFHMKMNAVEHSDLKIYFLRILIQNSIQFCVKFVKIITFRIHWHRKK